MNYIPDSSTYKYGDEPIHVQQEINREFVDLVKSHPCMDCGQSFPPIAMDFDHVRGNKLRAISRMINQASLSDICDEMKKCELVCSNCHRIRTHKRHILVFTNEAKEETEDT